MKLPAITLLLTSLFAGVLHAQDGNHWGVQADGGAAFIPNALIEAVQDRYTASLNGYVYSAGLVRFHASGAPSFSLNFSGMTLDGTAADKQSTGSYSGSAHVNGFMVKKYVNFIARPRFSMGLAFGTGLGQQFKADYTLRLTVRGATVSQNKQYVLKELPVTPLSEFQIRADVRVSRNLSIGPWVGLRNGLPVVGGAVRVHILK